MSADAPRTQKTPNQQPRQESRIPRIARLSRLARRSPCDNEGRSASAGPSVAPPRLERPRRQSGRFAPTRAVSSTRVRSRPTMRFSPLCLPHSAIETDGGGKADNPVAAKSVRSSIVVEIGPGYEPGSSAAATAHLGVFRVVRRCGEELRGRDLNRFVSLPPTSFCRWREVHQHECQAPARRS